MVANDQRQSVAAYFSEADSARVEKAALGRFYPESPSFRPFAVQLLEFGPANINVLTEPYVASLVGGAIAVDKNEKGEWVPNETTYRLTFAPVGEVQRVGQVLRGTVVLQGDARSLLARGWDAMLAVLIRESGF